MSPPRTADMEALVAAIDSSDGVRTAQALRAKVVRAAMQTTAETMVGRDVFAARKLSGAAMLIDDEAACLLGRLIR